MPTTKAAQKAVNKYTREKYDRINLTVQKGERAEIAIHATERGEKVNAFIKRAITSQMKRDTATDFFDINRSVDEDVHDYLTAEAEKKGMTINNMLMEMIAKELF
jgi:predicted HicB family RNase H-like nuclease